MKSDDDAAELKPKPARGVAFAETGLILLLFFIFAAWPAPDVNEAHYLAKAKHYWNPQWCEGDHFLESADAHQVFYWTFGWLTLLLPLPAVAWVGRLLTWGLLACAWQRLSFAVVPKTLVSVLSAGLFLSLLQRCSMAGEWVIGGVEAKGFAYVFVVLAMEAIVKNRWRAVWLLLGVASGFHVLVGGWSVFAAGVAWLVSGKQRARLLSMLPALVAGFVLSLPGLVPGLALTRGVDPEVVAEANEIYVIERLSHHLLFFEFESHFVAFHGAMLALWTLLWLLTRGDDSRRRLNGFVLGAVLIALAGLAIDIATYNHPAITAKWMRYYWYRMSDAVLPMGAALMLCAALARLALWRPIAAQWCLLAAMLLVGLNFGERVLRQQEDLRPRADAQSLPAANPPDPAQDQQIYEDWRNVCVWIAENTEKDARFLTPRHQQTFKWYAGRSEVFNWKDIPQDAEGIVEWWGRYEDVYLPQGRFYPLAHRYDVEVVDLARWYDADYLVADRTRGGRDDWWRYDWLVRVYPPENEENDSSYAVYAVPPKP